MAVDDLKGASKFPSLSLWYKKTDSFSERLGLNLSGTSLTSNLLVMSWCLLGLWADYAQHSGELERVAAVPLTKNLTEGVDNYSGQCRPKVPGRFAFPLLCWLSGKSLVIISARIRVKIGRVLGRHGRCGALKRTNGEFGVPRSKTAKTPTKQGKAQQDQIGRVTGIGLKLSKHDYETGEDLKDQWFHLHGHRGGGVVRPSVATLGRSPAFMQNPSSWCNPKKTNE